MVLLRFQVVSSNPFYRRPVGPFAFTQKKVRYRLSDPLLSCGACNELGPLWIRLYCQCPAEGVDISVVRRSPAPAGEEYELSDPADDLLRVCILTANKLRQ